MRNTVVKRDRWMVKKREAEEASSWPPWIFLGEANDHRNVDVRERKTTSWQGIVSPIS